MSRSVTGVGTCCMTEVTATCRFQEVLQMLHVLLNWNKGHWGQLALAFAAAPAAAARAADKAATTGAPAPPAATAAVAAPAAGAMLSKRLRG